MREKEAEEERTGGGSKHCGPRVGARDGSTLVPGGIAGCEREDLRQRSAVAQRT